MKGHYTHLALVDNPRYEEAEIMTPEQFKMYKEEKRTQLKDLENSKQTKGEGKTMKWKLFKKTEVTNSDDLSKVMVELSNGSTVSIGEMVNSVEADLKKEEEEKNKCNEADVLEKVVKVNGEDMTVAELVKEYESKCNKCNEDEEKKPEAEEEKKDADEEPKEEPKAEEAKEEPKEDKKNEAEEVDKRKGIDEIGGFLKEKGLSDEDIRFVIGLAEKLSYEKDEAGKDNEDIETEEKVEEDLTLADKKNAEELIKAEEKANAKQFQGQVVDTMSRRLARGQDRYGSAK